MGVKAANTFHRDYSTWSRGIMGVLQQSEISFLTDLLKGVGKKIGETLFVASLDGDAASEFHSLCDDQGATLVFVETTTGLIFGGYNDASWSSDTGYSASTASFLFQLRPTMAQFSISTQGYSVYGRSDYGPTFGGGHDLHISSGAMSNEKSYTRDHSYGSHELNEGERHFQVKDYVVLKASSL